MTKSTLHPWQEKFIVDIEAMSTSPGFKAGEMTIMMAGRSTGKSVLMQQYAALWKDIFAEKPISDLVCEEGKVLGARYYTVEPVGGKWAEMEEWAKQSFGEPADLWEKDKFMWPDRGRWLMNDRKFWFRDLKDRDWFVMRWRS